MSQEVVIDYTNYRGERKEYRIRPLPNAMHYGETDYHKPAQWLVTAIDVERMVERTFAMKDIHSWKPATGASPAAPPDIVKPPEAGPKWG